MVPLQLLRQGNFSTNLTNGINCCLECDSLLVRWLSTFTEGPCSQATVKFLQQIPLETTEDLTGTSLFSWHVHVINSQAITQSKINVPIICSSFINLIQDLSMGSLTHYLLPLIFILALTYIINPQSGTSRCSSVTWIYANGCLHMLISHIYIKLNSLLHCFLTPCPHMINFSDFFQNRY